MLNFIDEAFFISINFAAVIEREKKLKWKRLVGSCLILEILRDKFESWIVLFCYFVQMQKLDPLTLLHKLTTTTVTYPFPCIYFTHFTLLFNLSFFLITNIIFNKFYHLSKNLILINIKKKVNLVNYGSFFPYSMVHMSCLFLCPFVFVFLMQKMLIWEILFKSCATWYVRYTCSDYILSDYSSYTRHKICMNKN